MEDLLLGLLGPLLEAFAEPLLELFCELAGVLLCKLTQGWITESALSCMILLVAGGETGFLSTLAIPYRLIAPHFNVPGISLLLAPVGAGSALYFAGKLVRRLGWGSSIFAGFRGGALFALSMALVRWCLLAMQPW